MRLFYYVLTKELVEVFETGSALLVLIFKPVPDKQ